MAVPVVCNDGGSHLFRRNGHQCVSRNLTHDIETPGLEMENVEVAPPMVCPMEELQTLSPREESDKGTTIIDTDKTVTLRKKKVDSRRPSG
ncbi:hypothetical protein FWK35_00009707 [Aphis craccivora]|uniref:Uncharacterized protein n=1 Tax=Aphis craccivora TaxID=307492 RepID=A0A6G0Z7E8_APHCR|nr:hypothetical protein FWK35_00009707 [Aphis craccivora]